MIEARIVDAAAFSQRLADRAAALAAAWAEARLRSQQGDPTRWRRAALLWPLTGGSSNGN